MDPPPDPMADAAPQDARRRDGEQEVERERA